MKSNKENLPDPLKGLVEALQESTGGTPLQSSEPTTEPVAVSMFKVAMQLLDHQRRVSRAFRQSEKAIRDDLLERLCNSDPEMAAARHRPPIRCRSASLDAVCCALELMRCHHFADRDAAAEWMVQKSSGLIDKKIAGVVLSLANPGYQRNRGKHRKDSFRRKDLKLEVLDSHRAWSKYRKLATEGFSSMAFSAILLAAEYELGGDKVRARRMPGGLVAFLNDLGFYAKEAKGYASLIRDEGALAARIGWGYSYKAESMPTPEDEQ